MVPTGGLSEAFAKAGQTFETAVEKIGQAAQVVIAKLRTLNDPPGEMEIEFGLKVTTEAGVVITAGGEVHYKVTLTWKRRDLDEKIALK
jgi:hypothetical protein